MLKTFVWVTIFLLLGLTNIYGQPASLQAANTLPLPGRPLTIEEAARECRGAVVARLIDLEAGDAGPPGATRYGYARWEIISVLRGTYPPEAGLSLTVQLSPEGSKERVPEVGKTYIVLSYGEGSCQIRKMVENNAEKMREVSAVLAKRGQANHGLNPTRSQQVCYSRRPPRAG